MDQANTSRGQFEGKSSTGRMESCLDGLGGTGRAPQFPAPHSPSPSPPSQGPSTAAA